MPSVTVVVPSFNHANYLAECLASLSAQTLVDWEAVVVDDASTEGDIAGVVEACDDRRITYTRHERNLGAAAARNTGIRAGTADLIAPVDSDDILEPGFLERLCGELDDRPEADCSFPDFVLFGDASGRRNFGDGEVHDLVARQWLPGPGLVYRRRLWERVGGYCEDPALSAGNEDWDFYLAAAEAGFTARHVDEVLYRYRVGSTSTGMRLQYVNYLTREFILGRHRAFFERFGGARRFLAEGYAVSAKASLARFERRRALTLAFHALRLDPRTRNLAPVILRSLLPGPILSAGQRLRRSRRARDG